MGSATPTTGTLVLMGSGETTPTMVSTHQRVLARTRERLGRPALGAVLLDTPYGFQENAGEITAKARHYFAHNVVQAVDPVAAGVLDGADPVAVERALDRVRRADWVFAGPGSPTYALRQWTAVGFADALVDVVRRGGTLVLASAAAVTAGTRALPVYEVYKAGEAPAWRMGLGVVERLTGWPCAVVPHFDNAEGGTHDTRFCYMGERRLAALEAELPDGGWVLGIDEHTACAIDLAAGTVAVEGRGGVHVRRAGAVVRTIPAGSSVAVADVAEADAAGSAAAPTAAAVAVRGPGAPAEPFEAQVLALRGRFDAAVEALDADGATAAALELEALIRDWSADTEDSDAGDRAVASLRGMITRLGSLAGEGMHDHTELVRPIIETLLHVRDDARARKVYEVADHIRGHMDADGVKVRDTRDGTEWEWEAPPL
jgi:hypothetical protein